MSAALRLARLFCGAAGSAGDGHWSIAPQATAHCTRRYLDHTLVLETTFETGDGSARLLDFMPLRDRTPHLIRIVRGVHGKVALSMELVLRFDYGRTVPWVSRLEDGVLRAIAGPDMAVLYTGSEVHGENLKTVSEFTVSEGESVHFVLSYGPSYDELPPPADPEQALQETVGFWQEWSSRARLHGEYAGAVERSLITLKALTYRHTGGIVAAPTMSLPEQLGGQRNWDYRYCWLRDATFTLLALMNAGYLKRRAPGAIGCCGLWPAVPTRCRSCTAFGASGICRSGRSTGFPDTKIPNRCALATPLPNNCSWTFTVR